MPGNNAILNDCITWWCNYSSLTSGLCVLAIRGRAGSTNVKVSLRCHVCAHREEKAQTLTF